MSDVSTVPQPSPLRKWAAERGVTLTRVMRDSGVAWRTVHKAARGEPVTEGVAMRISAATGGEVTVSQLCGREIEAGFRV